MEDFTKEELEYLRTCPMLRDLPDTIYQHVLAMSSRVSFAQGDTLLSEGEHSDLFFIILSGSVGLHKQNIKGRPQELLVTLSSGQTLGEMRVIQDRPISLTVKALEATTLLCISISSLKAQENQACYDAILGSIIAILNTRLVNSNDAILGTINEKKRKAKQVMFTSLISIILAFLLLEVGVALYFAMNTESFCNQFSSHPEPTPNISQRLI